MKHWACSVALVAACALAAACQPAPLSDTDKAAIQKAHDDYVAAVVNPTGDYAAMAKAYYTDGARLLPANMPAVEGQAAITQLYNLMGHPKAFKFGPLTIDGRGDMATIEGTYELAYAPLTGDTPVADKGKFFETAQKQADGSWKVSRDIWNSDQPGGLVVLGAPLKADASAELKQLDWFAGKWTMEGETTGSPMFGPAGKISLTMDCRWFMGGGNLVCAVDGTTPGGPYHDLMIHTYDAEAKTYRGFDSDNMGTSSPFMLSFGKEGWVYTYDLKVNGKPVKMRQTVTDLTKDTCSFKQETSTGGGPFTVIGEGKGKKLPG